MAGTDQHFRLDEFHDTMRSRIVSVCSDALASSRVPVLDLAKRYGELGEALLPLINPQVTEKYGIESVHYAHAGAGELHLRPLFDLRTADGLRMFRAVATDVAALVKRYRGSLSGEHGDGLSRTWFVRQQYGPLYEVFREVKRLFDPLHILNPGKVIAETPQPLTHHLRPQLAETHIPRPRFPRRSRRRTAQQ